MLETVTKESCVLLNFVLDLNIGDTSRLINSSGIFWSPPVSSALQGTTEFINLKTTVTFIDTDRKIPPQTKHYQRQ